jgi:hypothetical protein
VVVANLIALRSVLLALAEQSKTDAGAVSDRLNHELIKVSMFATMAPDFVRGSYDQPWISLSTASGPPGGDLGQTSASLQSDPYLFSNFGARSEPHGLNSRADRRDSAFCHMCRRKKRFSRRVGGDPPGNETPSGDNPPLRRSAALLFASISESASRPYSA